jgi:sugar-1,4-lactone oxidase-like protein
MPRVFNWSRHHSCDPVRVERPEDEAGVVALVKEARAKGLGIKVVGARHSWSDIAMGDGILVSLERLQDVVELDVAASTVRAQAGIRLHRLNDELDARGFALPIVGSVVEQSLAGVMSTGTHGSSLVHGNMPSFVVGMRLVTGTGEVLVLDEGHDLLPAARVGLGAMGIITEVTIRVVPAFQLCERTETISLDQALEDMDSIARSAEYVKLWWLPHTNSVVVFRTERTSEPGAVSKLARWVDRVVLNKIVFTLLLLLGRFLPALIAPVNRVVARTYLKPRCTIGRSDRVLTLAMPPRHRETEYAVPLDQAAEALRRTKALVDGGIAVNFIVEVRFVRADDGWMSPASGRDTCQLGAYMADAPGIQDYFDGFAAAMKELGGRPHWGKELRCTPEEIRGMYEHAEDFASTVRELDPDGVFTNPFVDRLFPR